MADPQPTAVETQLHAALDNMPGALVYTDKELNIVVCNERFREMYPVPRELLQPGRPYPDFLRCLAQRGYYGQGDPDALVAQRVESLRNPSGRSFEDHVPDGRWYRIRRHRAPAGGTVTVMTDITEQKQAERELADKERQLHVALDNMPGALVYTDDDLKIVVCNNRFKEMYTVPQELLQPGRPYPDFLRYLAENGYYGQGDAAALVAQRVESLRNPSGKSFEDHVPDGRCYRILRHRVPAGGTVTVMTDVTEQKLAERELLDATREARRESPGRRLRSSASPGSGTASRATARNGLAVRQPRPQARRRAGLQGQPAVAAEPGPPVAAFGPVAGSRIGCAGLVETRAPHAAAGVKKESRRIALMHEFANSIAPINDAFARGWHQL
jgi:PAS domain-containing protein